MATRLGKYLDTRT